MSLSNEGVIVKILNTLIQPKKRFSWFLSYITIFSILTIKSSSLNEIQKAFFTKMISDKRSTKSNMRGNFLKTHLIRICVTKIQTTMLFSALTVGHRTLWERAYGPMDTPIGYALRTYGYLYRIGIEDLWVSVKYIPSPTGQRLDTEYST